MDYAICISSIYITTLDNVDVPVAVKSVVVVPPLAVRNSINVDAPVTPNVPATKVLPVIIQWEFIRNQNLHKFLLLQFKKMDLNYLAFICKKLLNLYYIYAVNAPVDN